jgi:hypothetical protein
MMRRVVTGRADQIMKETVEPLFDTTRKEIGKTICNHSYKLAKTYADHADEMAQMLKSAGHHDSSDWASRAVGAREVALTIRKSQDRLFGQR